MLQNYLKQVTITNMNPSEHKIRSELCLTQLLSKAKKVLNNHAHQEEKGRFSSFSVL